MTRCLILALLFGCKTEVSPAADASVGPGSDASGPGAALDEFVSAQMASSKIPGLAAAIVKRGDVVWSHGYGYADVAAKKPVTPDTLFMLASISKTFVVVPAMQLVEDGRLDLDADVNQYLPYSIRNPAFPTTKITMRHLLSHSAGIEDTDASYEYTVGDSPITLRDWLASYLIPNGARYSAGVWSAKTPGTQYSYSNQGVALAAYVIERVAGMPFDAYCEANVFPQVAMTETSWRLAALDASHIAIPYEAGMPQQHYGYADYPAGALRTSVVQLGHFLAMMARQGEYNGMRVVEAASVTEMLRIQFPNADDTQGLVFYHYNIANVGSVVGHDGLDIGVLTTMAYRPSDGVGAIVLTNGYSNQAGLAAVFFRLFDEAAPL